MENNDVMCYITYAVPARLMPPLPFGENPIGAVPVAPTAEHGADSVYPEGFMPEWFLRGSFPEDEY